MSPFTVRLLAVGVVGITLGLGRLVVGQTDDVTSYDKSTMAQSAIIELGEMLVAKDVSERARRIVREHDSEHISSVFKIKKKGGLGIGKLTEIANTPDGIGVLMSRLSSRRTITEAEIEKYADDYRRVAKVLQAMAEVAPHRATKRVQKSAKLTAEWNEVTSEFKEGASSFRKAVDEIDPKMLRLAAGKLSNTCCHCHELSDQ